jgi:hypothetical protein
MKRFLLAFSILVGIATAQVVLITPPKFNSVLQDGTPNAFGCVWTYQNNTTVPLATQTDYSSGINNPNPVPLDSGGSANIWLQAGQIYTIVIKSAGGVNCASGATVSTTNGVNQSILNLNNTWNGTQTFLSQVFFNPSDLQLVFGAPSGTQTTLDIPPTSANFILHGPPITGNDTLLSQNATQTVQNKNFTSGTQINGCGVTNGPGTYVCIANNGSTATVLNNVAILTGSPSTATIAPLSIANTGSTLGIVGVVVANAGITGTAVIQQTGLSQCTFDGATAAGQYVYVSPFSNGLCSTDSNINDGDPGTNPYGAFGIVLSTNGGPGTYAVMLFPQITHGAVIGTGVPFTANGNTTANQQLLSNVVLGPLRAGSTFRATAEITVVPGGGASNQIIFWSFPIPTLYTALTTSSSSTTITAAMTLTCVVVTPGVSGTASCANSVTTNTGTVTEAINASGNLSNGFGVGNFCSFSVASASNTCTENMLSIERLN